ncbi:MAG: hypothetical protein BVN35_20350 [Proteobacteria bacterium ST_bin11]|nr:MAG: hypothetical protein BVN35_20350 [Proteobacteria bacterium ST_bin11]
MSNDKTAKQDALELQQQIELGSVQLENAKALQGIDEMQQKEKDKNLQDGYLVNQIIGRAQMANAMQNFSKMATISQLIKVKENKLYRHLKGCRLPDKDGNEIANVSTWEGFCQAVGISRAKADTDIADVKVFGQEVVEAMEMAGIGYRQRSQLRSISGDELTTVIGEIEENIGNEQAIVALVESVITKHNKEKQKLTEDKEAVQQKLDDATAKNEANERFLKVKDQKINELERVVNKSLTPDEERKLRLDQEQQLKNELGRIEAECAIAIDKLNIAIDKVFSFGKASEELQALPRNTYEYLLKHMVNVADDNELKFDALQILSPILYNLSSPQSQGDNG